MMEMELYEDVLTQCGELFSQARTLDSPKNRQAIEMAAKALQFCRLEMSRVEIKQQTLLQTIRYLESDDADAERGVQFRFEESDAVFAIYTIYPQQGQEAWSDRLLKWHKIFLLQLHEANVRQNLTQDANYYRYHDPQTKHTNMAYFSECCDIYIKEGKIENYTALAVNLSDFTNMNLVLGSNNCDTVLVRYMDWLKEGMREDEIISRVSGDQFALLIHKDREGEILEKLKSSQIRYGQLPGEVANVSAEAGIFRLNADVESYHTIIQAISSALNIAKNSVQLQFSYYDPLSADASARKKFYEEEFKKALVNEDIHVFFQPKVSLKDYDLIGAEALSRWIVDGEIIPPDTFIPILEETTRICELDFYVLEHVCKSIQSWMQHNVKPVKVSVNFSRRHLSNKNLVEDIVNMLDKYEVPHEYIEVELTETTIDADFAALKEIVHGLRSKGIESSVDDFGMGYSSLSLIRDVPFKVLKIDKSFLSDKNMESDERQRAMMKHVISMANDLGMECIAEGVESMEHVQLLKENKCYMAQGFLFNRPIPQEEFESILMQL